MHFQKNEKGIEIIMEKNQRINCTVQSCAYQDENTKCCTLHAINVVPTPNNNSMQPDESKCGSYECSNN